MPVEMKCTVQFFPCKTDKCDKPYLLMAIGSLHKWCLNLNNNTHTSLASHSCFKTKEFSQECEAKDVPSIVIQI